MKLIVAGPRSGPEDPDLIAAAVAASPFSGRVTMLLEGGARGIDRAARLWAEREGVDVATISPDWVRYGRAAGPVRNRAMVGQANGLLLLGNASTRGSKSVLGLAERARRRRPDFEIFVAPLAIGSCQLERTIT